MLLRATVSAHLGPDCPIGDMAIALLLGFFRRLDGDSQPAAPAPRRHGLCHAGTVLAIGVLVPHGP